MDLPTCTVKTAVNERRRTPRFPFIADVEILHTSSGARMFARTTDISLYGCFLDMGQPLPNGSQIVIKIFTGGDFLEAQATVVYSQPNLGVGVAFREVKPHFLPTLKKWLQKAMREFVP